MNPQRDLIEIEGLLDWMKGARNFIKWRAQKLSERNKFEEGCREIKDCGFWGERRCGNFEDLKHSDHYIYCPDCQAKKKIQEIAKEVLK